MQTRRGLAPSRRKTGNHPLDSVTFEKKKKKKSQQQGLGAELTKLACEMFPLSEEILPKKGGGRGGVECTDQGEARSADQCVQESGSIIHEC